VVKKSKLSNLDGFNSYQMQNFKKGSGDHLRLLSIYYSHGQPKPTYFVAVGIPILDMTETPGSEMLELGVAKGGNC
jgi:hypothetical protein